MTWSASWIWLPAQQRMDNLYVLARTQFDCPVVPASAPARVSGSQLYKLYVNGRYVGRGPNPADPSYYYYDVHDLAPYLVPGRNVISLIGFCYSETLQGIIGQNWGIGGLLFEMAEPVRVISDESWKVLQAPAWDQASDINCTLYGDYKEYYDTRKELPGWQLAGFDDRAWPQARVIGRPPVAPWTVLREREIPFLGGETLRPIEAYWESASVTYAWRDDWEVYHEGRLVSGADGYPHPGKFTEIRKTRDLAPSILLDFGRLVTGYVEIRIHDSQGGTIDLLYGENLGLTRVDRFELNGGEQVLEPFNRRTFRYLRLLFPEVLGRIKIDAVLLHMNTYPVEAKGSFSCSDALITTIWTMSAYTMRLSMLDHFVDCPWRERTIYGGDVYAENPIAYYAFGDPRLNAKTLRQMFALQYPEGALPPYGPYLGVHGFYPSWSAFFGLAFLDHWRFTGDHSFRDELWPGLARLCDWAVNEIARNALPMIGSPATGGSFSAWMAQPKVSYQAWENYPFYLLLSRAATLAMDLHRDAEEQRWSGAATRMAAAMDAHLVDADSGLVRTYPAASPPAYTQFDGALRLWAQAAPAREGRELGHRLLQPGQARVVESPFHGFFLIEGLAAYGETGLALDFMRMYWGDMVRRGATTFWEHHAIDSPPGRQTSRGGSVCHGWSAAPAYACGAHVLGVTPLTPGFATVAIAPQFGDLSWAEGRVPTPHGPVAMAWQRSSERCVITIDSPRPVRLSPPHLHEHLPAMELDGATITCQIGAPWPTFELPAGRHQLRIMPR